MKMIKPIVNFAKIADDYDTFVFGFNGVLSKGNQISPATVECLRKLASLGKKNIILSNTNLRVTEVIELLNQANLPPQIFTNIVTSGEMLHYRLKHPRDDFAALGNSYYQIGAIEASGIMSGLAINRVAEINQAHFLFMASATSCDDTIEKYRPLMEKAVSLGLPFVCAGNDTSCFIDGHIALAPGALAEAYAVLGGRVITLGKPDINMLKYAFEGIGNLGRIVIVGDNVSTDIKLATIADLSSILVSKGRHVNYLGEGYIPDVAKTRELANSFEVSPDCVISEVRW